MPVFNVLGAKLILKILRAPRYKKPYTLATPPPWSKVMEWKTAIDARPALAAVTKDFAFYAHRTADKALSDRLKAISAVMKGKKYLEKFYPPEIVAAKRKARMVRPKMTAEQLRAFIEELKAAVPTVGE